MRNFIIKKLTQSTTWFAVIIILSAIFFPKSWIIVVGLLIAVTDDAHMQAIFSELRKWIESIWPE